MFKKIKDIEFSGEDRVKDLVNKFKDAGGFTAKKIAIASEIIYKMHKSDSFNFLSFPADIISTGTRGIIKDLLKNKIFDLVITTTGTLDHDLARLWSSYYEGSEKSNDIELKHKKINRLYNIFIPYSNYGEILENKLQPIFKEIGEGEFSSYELIWEIGKRLKDKNKEESIVYWAYKNNIPIIIPGFTDGAVGSQAWLFYQKHRNFKINTFKDEDKLAEIVFHYKKTGALMLGGGISKHHTIWWNQFKGGLNYAVYITSANEWDGSLSGADLSEAISWGKIREDADVVTIHGEITAILPLVLCKVL
ncbi:MAG: deoxyhypusine synthase [Candidatus Rehaiarchaeum fermentans]|nr:deoxyhypusine synthase [Candidatus Rehaiarchaeum fermentans]